MMSLFHLFTIFTVVLLGVTIHLISLALHDQKKKGELKRRRKYFENTLLSLTPILKYSNLNRTLSGILIVWNEI